MSEIMEELIDSAFEGLAEGVSAAVNEGMSSKSVWTRYIIRALVIFLGVGGGVWLIMSGAGCMSADKDKGETLIFFGIVLIAVSVGLVLKSIIRNRRKHDE